MPEHDWVNTLILVALWVGLIYGLFGLSLAYLALVDLEWRQLIAGRLRQEWRGLRLRLTLVWVNLLGLVLRGCRRLQGNRVR